MKMVWLCMLIGSSLLLAWVLLKNRISWGWLRGFALHLILAAGLLYIVNEMELVPGMHIPLSPFTIGATVVLGVPGVMMLAGLQWVAG
ncbi:pro-sigmaK processing inhibitor BofA family protein [Paenibacillus sp. GCM10027627]|uniref:pro-sigmaK processing inhibitor BofA family protein n=1 Tax=unclassified Paenibacillus TaxID=185978 RepID=UPI0036270070